MLKKTIAESSLTDFFMKDIKFSNVSICCFYPNDFILIIWVRATFTVHLNNLQ